MGRVRTIPTSVLLSSELLSVEESQSLRTQIEGLLQLTPSDILKLDLPAKNRVEALLQCEFLADKQLRSLACDFAEHTLRIFEDHALGDHRPRKCIEVARLYISSAGPEDLQRAVKNAIPAVWRFEKTGPASAFLAGLAVTFLDSDDASVMARAVTTHCQRAAHRKAWESRKSNFELMIRDEKEALWQLSRTAKALNLTNCL